MLKGFERYLLDQEKSTNTIKSYVGHAACFVKWHTGFFGGGPKKLRRIAVLDYLSYLRSVKNATPKTINAKVCAMIKLNEFLIEKGVQDRIVVSKKDRMEQKREEPNTDVITPAEVEDFLRRIHEHEINRDYALVTVLAYAGLRISEALDLRVSDIDFAGKTLVANGGTNRKQVRVPMDDRVRDAVCKYINERKVSKDSSEYLFKSRQGERLNRTRVNQIFNKHSDCLTPSKLRGFCYTNNMKKKGSVSKTGG